MSLRSCTVLVCRHRAAAVHSGLGSRTQQGAVMLCLWLQSWADVAHTAQCMNHVGRLGDESNCVLTR